MFHIQMKLVNRDGWSLLERWDGTADEAHDHIDQYWTPALPDRQFRVVHADSVAFKAPDSQPDKQSGQYL